MSQYTLTQNELKKLSEVVREFTTETTTIVAVPGEIRNNGRWVFAIQVTIGYEPKNKIVKGVYRGLPSNFRKWLREQIDKIQNS